MCLFATQKHTHTTYTIHGSVSLDYILSCILIYILDNCYLSKLIFELQILHDGLWECQQHLRMHVAWICLLLCLWLGVQVERQRESKQERLSRSTCLWLCVVCVLNIMSYSVWRCKWHEKPFGKMVVCMESTLQVNWHNYFPQNPM